MFIIITFADGENRGKNTRVDGKYVNPTFDCGCRFLSPEIISPKHEKESEEKPTPPKYEVTV